MNQKDIVEWSEEDVSQWLKNSHFPDDLINLLASHHLTGKILLNAKDEYLCQHIFLNTELKLKIRILTAISQLKTEKRLWNLQQTVTKRMRKRKHMHSKSNNAPVSIIKKKRKETQMDEGNAIQMKVEKSNIPLRKESNKKQLNINCKKLHPDITLRRKNLQSNQSQISTNSHSLWNRIPKQRTSAVSAVLQNNEKTILVEKEVCYSSKVSIIRSEDRGRKGRQTKQQRGRNRNRSLKQRGNGRKQREEYNHERREEKDLRSQHFRSRSRKRWHKPSFSRFEDRERDRKWITDKHRYSSFHNYKKYENEKYSSSKLSDIPSTNSVHNDFERKMLKKMPIIGLESPLDIKYIEQPNAHLEDNDQNEKCLLKRVIQKKCKNGINCKFLNSRKGCYYFHPLKHYRK